MPPLQWYGFDGLFLNENSIKRVHVLLIRRIDAPWDLVHEVRLSTKDGVYI